MDKLPTPWKSTVRQMTPDLAMSILEKNTGNRTIRPSKVSEYAIVIRNGDWQLTPQGVIISKDGRLLDGQHRLHAIVKSGVTVPMVVSEGVDEELYKYLDRGAARSTADALNEDKKFIETVRFLCRRIRGNSVVPDFLIAEVLTRLRPQLQELYEYCASTTRIYSAAPIRAAVILHMTRGPAYKDYAMRMYKAMVRTKIHDLELAPAAFMASLIKGKTTTAATTDLFLRAYKALDYDNRDISRIIIRNNDLMADEIEGAMKDFLSESFYEYVRKA